MKRNLEFPKFSVLDSLGNPLSGGKVYFYEAGTSTLKDTYSDPEGTTKNSNPVVLDSRGEADIYLDRDPYKIVVKDASDVTIMTKDNYQAYMAADDTPVENLLINADARSNENGYVSGTAVVAGDDIYDAWTCAADGAVTFIHEGDITLPFGVKIQHTNDDMTAMTGETVTLSVKSGSVEVTGFGLTSLSVVSVGNPITFVADGANPIVLGGGNTYTFSGLTLVKGNAATNTVRRPYLLERLLSNGYVDGIAENITLYLDPSGDDVTGNGTINNPWFSINRAMEFLADKVILHDVTINLAAGTYVYTQTQTVSHTDANKISIIGAGYGAINYTKIQNSTTNIVEFVDCNNITVDNFILDGNGSFAFVGMKAVNSIINVTTGIAINDIPGIWLINSQLIAASGSEITGVDNSAYGITLDNSKLIAQSISLTGIPDTDGILAKNGSFVYLAGGTVEIIDKTYAFHATNGSKIISIGTNVLTGSGTSPTATTGSTVAPAFSNYGSFIMLS